MCRSCEVTVVRFVATLVALDLQGRMVDAVSVTEPPTEVGDEDPRVVHVPEAIDDDVCGDTDLTSAEWTNVHVVNLADRIMAPKCPRHSVARDPIGDAVEEKLGARPKESDGDDEYHCGQDQRRTGIDPCGTAERERHTCGDHHDRTGEIGEEMEHRRPHRHGCAELVPRQPVATVGRDGVAEQHDAGTVDHDCDHADGDDTTSRNRFDKYANAPVLKARLRSSGLHRVR